MVRNIKQSCRFGPGMFNRPCALRPSNGSHVPLEGDGLTNRIGGGGIHVGLMKTIISLTNHFANCKSLLYCFTCQIEYKVRVELRWHSRTSLPHGHSITSFTKSRPDGFSERGPVIATSLLRHIHLFSNWH